MCLVLDAEFKELVESWNQNFILEGTDEEVQGPEEWEESAKTEASWFPVRHPLLCLRLVFSCEVLLTPRCVQQTVGSGGIYVGEWRVYFLIIFFCYGKFRTYRSRKSITSPPVLVIQLQQLLTLFPLSPPSLSILLSKWDKVFWWP